MGVEVLRRTLWRRFFDFIDMDVKYLIIICVVEYLDGLLIALYLLSNCVSVYFVQRDLIDSFVFIETFLSLGGVEIVIQEKCLLSTSYSIW